jgi:hypothetical protein
MNDLSVIQKNKKKFHSNKIQFLLWKKLIFIIEQSLETEY